MLLSHRHDGYILFQIERQITRYQEEAFQNLPDGALVTVYLDNANVLRRLTTTTWNGVPDAVREGIAFRLKRLGVSSTFSWEDTPPSPNWNRGYGQMTVRTKRMTNTPCLRA